MNKTNLTQHGRSTDVYASDVLYPTDKKNILKKKREFIKNDDFLWQFMLYKNINQNNNGQFKSSSDRKALEYELENWWEVALTHQNIDN